MDVAERRFRACTNRFKRDLTRIISRSIAGMVREALRDSRKKSAHEAAIEKQAAREANRAARIAQKAADKQARIEAREAKRAAAKAEKARRKEEARANRAGEQLELKLGLAGLRPSKSGGRSRVRADSLLGAELADGERGATLPSPGAAPKQPSERPLFVHKRARDGQIHALRRGGRESAASVRENAAREGVVRESVAPVRESVAPAAPQEPKPDTEARERSGAEDRP